MKLFILKTAFIICFVAALLPAGTLAAETDSWQFGASIYGWFPDIAGETAFTQPGGSNEFKIDIDDILDNLEFTLMGMFDARKGRWGFLTDVIYMDVGGSQTGTREATIGGTPIPVDANADVNLDLESWVWTLAGYFRAVNPPGLTLDLVAGARYLDVEQKVNWQINGTAASIQPFDRSGTATAELENWDAVFGVRGRFSFGSMKTWFVPYYFDLGAGDSDFTWQGTAGLGYAFGWVEVVGVWRYLYYDFSSGKPIKDINFSGPAIGATFRW